MPPNFSGYRAGFALDRHLGDEHREHGHRSGVLAGGGLRCSAQYGAAPLVFGVARVLLNALRSVPELIMGIIFVAAVGFGALPGVLALGLHSVGMVGKFFAKGAIEHVDEAPVETARAAGLRRSGNAAARGFATGDAAVRRRGDLPLGIQLSRLTVMGMVGAGGNRLRTHGLAAHHAVPGGCSNLLVILAMVTLVDAFSGVLRKRFQ